MLKIAITGGIGAGKTALTDFLEALGLPVLDADLIAHEITAPGGRAIPYLVRHFGSEVLNSEGGLDRAKMRERVFREETSRRLLEKGTTELVIEEIASRIAAMEANGETVVFVAAPLLFESGAAAGYDAVWLVTAEEETRLERVCKRDRAEREQVRRIMRAQMPEDEKKKRATDVLVNEESQDALRKQATRLLEKYGITGGQIDFVTSL